MLGFILIVGKMQQLKSGESGIGVSHCPDYTLCSCYSSSESAVVIAAAASAWLLNVPWWFCLCLEKLSAFLDLGWLCASLQSGGMSCQGCQTRVVHVI